MLYSGTGLQQKLAENARDGKKRVRTAPQSAPEREKGLWPCLWQYLGLG